MKKINYLIGVAAILLQSCANDDLVRPVNPDPSGDGAPMSFAAKKANQSRSSGLETKNYDFGVWAFKTQSSDGGVSATQATKEVVMPNYLVGYHGAVDAASNANPQPNLGYTSAGATETEGSWFYAGLGNNDGAHYVSGAGVASADATKSANTNQYLKYWDDSYANTYFYAYTPYNSQVTINQNSTDKKVTITFPDGNTGWMYASAKAENANHLSVPLEFKSIGSQLKIAFYNTIPGYDVEIVDYNSTTVPGFAFVPSKQTIISRGDEVSYAAKEIQMGGTPSVEYSIDPSGNITTNVVQGTPTSSSDGFKWTIPATPTTISTSSATATTFDAQSIVPQDCDCGFTLNVSFKLTAQDTKEEIYVRGARVHVPYAPVYFNWVSNHIYTFKFKITGNVPGTTGSFNANDFDFAPNPQKALYPIVFDDVTIADIDEEKQETIISAITIDQTELTVAVGATGTINVNLFGELAGGDLSAVSADASIATAAVNGNAVTVTGVADGSTTVTIKYTKDNNDYYANCAVTVTAAPANP